MNQVNDRPTLAKRAMNAVLWTIQVLRGVFFNITGFGKVLCYKAGRVEPNAASSGMVLRTAAGSFCLHRGLRIPTASWPPATRLSGASPLPPRGPPVAPQCLGDLGIREARHVSEHDGLAM